MKKIMITIATLAIFSTSGISQFEIENLFIGGNIGYAKPIGDFSEYAKGGISYGLEIGYDLDENLAVGLSYSSTATLAIDTTQSTGLFGINAYGLTNYFVKGWYKFTEGDYVPYAALGLGLSQFAEPDISVGGAIVSKGSRNMGLGAEVEVGMKLKSIRLHYNFVLGGKSADTPLYNPNIANLPIMYHKFMIGWAYEF